jgi:hypothetical protein
VFSAGACCSALPRAVRGKSSEGVGSPTDIVRPEESPPLDVAVAPKWTRSDYEAWFLTLVRDAGLPEPMHHLIVETDGWETHRTRAAIEHDRARDAALTADGWRVVRFTWHQPRATIQRRLQALLHH